MPEMNDSLPAELHDIFPDDVMMGRALPGAMLVDLKRISELTEEQIGKVDKALTSQDGLITVSDFRKLMASHFDSDLSASVTRTVISVIPEMVDQYSTVLERYRASNEQVAKMFTEATMDALKKNLNALIKDRPAIRLMRKAQRLLGDTGNELSSVFFVCDLRPVFDEAHENVEGLISLANLRLGYKTQSGHNVNLELALSENDLDFLIEQCEDAKAKLAVLERDYVDRGGSK
jgi:hypothetical protein